MGPYSWIIFIVLGLFVFAGWASATAIQFGEVNGDWSGFWIPLVWLIAFLVYKIIGFFEDSQAVSKAPQPIGVADPVAFSSKLNEGAPKPGRLLHPTPENFEEYCAEWCRYLGYQDAVKTQNSRDGGIDIRASNMIAQVKFQANPVGVGPIRELNGVKRGNQETLFFALNGYTPEARREASEIGMTLITVRPVEGTIDITA